MSRGKEVGKEQTYKINGEKITVKPEFTGQKTVRDYAKQAENFLDKINAETLDLDSGGLKDADAYAQVKWRMNDKHFEFRCEVFGTQKANMGAIAYYLRDWWRHVRRGLIDPLDSLEHLALPGGQYADMSVEELKERRKRVHPDANTPESDEEEFKRVQKAIEEKQEDQGVQL